MKRLLLLAAMCGIVLLAGAPAMAQETGPEFCYDGTLDPNYPNCPYYEGIDDPNYPAPDDGDPITLEGTCEGIVLQEDFEACIAAQEQYVPETPATPASTPAATEAYSELPDTGGASLIALGAGVLLAAGGLLIRRR